jgi:RimJ/RimL family protein N-acetyltransferase
MQSRSMLPERIEGERVVLLRHTPSNLPAFYRWYGDAEIARLNRHQSGPMRRDEIERFFNVRILGMESLALAIHVRGSGRLIGSCAFSQIDGDNGSALYHITIGERDAWNHGYGTEATDLMLGLAFDRLGLHRVTLTVFSFNERAVASYRKSGFVLEGTARQAIWRDGRFWDEFQMGILAEEWRTLRRAREIQHRDAEDGGAAAVEAGAGVADRDAALAAGSAGSRT